MNDKMRVKLRFYATSAFFLLIFVGLFGLLTYRSKLNMLNKNAEEVVPNHQPLITDDVRWQERAPQSVQEDYPNHNEIDLDNSVINDKNNKIINDKFEEQKRKGLMNTITATATAKPVTVLDDIMISVKTTKKFHNTRLDIILKTWFNLAKDQTWFFSDFEDKEIQRRTGNHLIDTKCPPTHDRKALCCKMSQEFDAFLESQKKWWCHFDDDQYVNIPTLVRHLESYDPQRYWYIGRPSINHALEILNKDNISQRISFWFATGGAGFCISRSLALKMMPLAGGGKFISVGEKIRLPDDVTMGYIIGHLLEEKLTIVNEFHSHLEPLRFFSTDDLNHQISFGYSKYGSHGSEVNAVPVEGLPKRVDPTRMFSLHCQLFPSSLYCPR